MGAADLQRELAAEFGAEGLALIAPYLTKRAIDSRATSRLDQADALGRLGEHITAAAALPAAAGDEPATARPAPDLPGFTITFDGDTHWMEHDPCSHPVAALEAGDSAEELFTKMRDHERTCTGNRGAQL